MSHATEPSQKGLLAQIGNVCGAQHVRAAGEGDDIDGQRPEVVAFPANTAEVSKVLKIANASNMHIVARGTATKLRWGNPPRGVDLVLDTTRMDTILEHVAGDLVVRAQAGVTLAALQAAVGKHGQRLALDPASGTLGGIVACNASGPLRHRFGTVRDLLIGSTVVLADGTVARSGGKVVKNVAGYDLGKIFTGSFGTLGVLTETIFRLHPQPSTHRVLQLSVKTAKDAAAAVSAVSASQLVPSALELSWDLISRTGVVQALFEGLASSVAGQIADACSLWKGLGELGELEDLMAPAKPGASIIKVAALPSKLSDVIERMQYAAVQRCISAEIRGSAAVGVFYLHFDAQNDPKQILEVLADLRGCPLGDHASVVLLQSPSQIAQVEDRWGEIGALELMRKVKERFDPQCRLAPGRFVGGI